ncbi:MAG: hypothetical protein EBT03_09395 [Betaproteobacteria bacterium]|nr:hypothetical protein [Betaproteobacteria bacterium]NCA17242.1 hypothetical protein [Betaproteobacteria bacterium]
MKLTARQLRALVESVVAESMMGSDVTDNFGPEVERRAEELAHHVDELFREGVGVEEVADAIKGAMFSLIEHALKTSGR